MSWHLHSQPLSEDDDYVESSVCSDDDYFSDSVTDEEDEVVLFWGAGAKRLDALRSTLSV
jgi:hypothetical protein